MCWFVFLMSFFNVVLSNNFVLLYCGSLAKSFADIDLTVFDHSRIRDNVHIPAHRNSCKRGIYVCLSMSAYTNSC